MNPLATNLFDRLFGKGPNLPSPEEARWLTESVDRTPDMSVLEESEFQLLFCPDRTQRGCSQYELIEDSVYLAYAFTLKRFNYWLQRDGLPIPMLATSNERLKYFPPPLKIKGEIHAVRPYQFAKLDKAKDNLVSFRRQRIKLLIPHCPKLKIPDRYENGKPVPLMTGQYQLGAERIKPIEAWMYVGEPNYWDGLMDAGYNSANLFSTVTHYKDDRPWLGEYYALKRERYF